MPETPDSAAKVSAEEFHVLVRIAGLEISGARVPLVLDELNAQLALARSLEPVLARAGASTFGPYDPAFPEIDLEDEAT